MNATARFEPQIRPDGIAVSSRGYLAAAILFADLRAARAMRREPPAEPPPRRCTGWCRAAPVRGPSRPRLRRVAEA